MLGKLQTLARIGAPESRLIKMMIVLGSTREPISDLKNRLSLPSVVALVIVVLAQGLELLSRPRFID